MHLDHINLCASDVSALTSTLESSFDYRILQSGRVPEAADVPGAGDEYAFLLGQDGSYIVVTHIEAQPDGRSSYPAQFHFGLMQDSAAAVHAKHAELEAAGFSPGRISAGFEVLGAVWTAFYCPVGDGLEIEVNHRTHSAILDRERPS